MGEIADMMREGILCACCGVSLVTEKSTKVSGVPTLCWECKKARPPRKGKRALRGDGQS